MPNNIIIFLRHAETKIDENLKISKWFLTKRGKKEATNISKLDLFNDIDIIITSNEEKAYQTAFPLAEK
ncbi:MAG: histidine phosphatase family protein, partial [Candidatus Lokiarchaeota archaeon]|nr:histidine phosphatase family protein [Candidatus Lokiarchaeota archaeon]